MSDSIPDPQAAAQALLRAIPLTRMVDIGVDVGSALRLTEGLQAGGELDVLAEKEADRLLEFAEQVDVTVRTPVRRAALSALIVAQLPFNDDSPRKRQLYARMADQLELLELENAGHYRNVTVPFRGAGLTGFLVMPDSVERPQTVILFGGFNGWGVAYLPVAEALAAAGLATLLIELPGQGNPRMTEHLYGGWASVEAVSACIDWIELEPSLGDRTGVWGNSYGGLIAALAAATEPRITAVCINGAPSRPTLPPFRTLQELMFAFFGTDSIEDLEPLLTTINFADREFTIDCPVLVLQGGADPTVSADDQRPFYDAGTAQRVWQEWPDGQHTMYNHPTERNALTANWFSRGLSGAAEEA